MQNEEADKLLEEILKDDGETSPQPSNEPTPPVEEKTNETKAYSERLKKDREKIKQETQLEIAKSMGYDTWEDYVEKRNENSMLDKGLDPETVKPLIKEMLKNDPDYIAAMEYKRDKEELEKELWAKNELEQLNKKFNLSLTSVDDLGEEVVKLWNSGIPLDKAYAAEHYEDIEKLAIKKAISKGNGKDHLINVGDNGNKTEKTVTASKEQIAYFKALNPDVTEEEITKYINK